jgi:hypothetical protein
MLPTNCSSFGNAVSEKIFRNRVSQPSYNLTDFGIGSVIIPVKKGKSLVDRYNLEKLYALQEEV